MNSENTDSVISINNVSKIYRMGEVDIPVLNGITTDISKGEFVSIMGPSGSGKSTLLYLIGGLDTPTTGEIHINGQNIAVVKDKKLSIMRRRDIGFIFQFYNLIPNLDVEDNIMLPVLLDGKKKQNLRDELEEILELVGLTDRRKHTPRELSGGQQQRVAIARALINSPDILLADEPIGNLDSKTGEDIMNLLKKINREKSKTIVQVTHSKDSAKYGEKIIYVKDGRICEDHE